MTEAQRHIGPELCERLACIGDILTLTDAERFVLCEVRDAYADLVAFATRRADRGGMYRSWCSGCGCSIKIDAKTLAEEFAGSRPLCHACRPGCAAPYGGSPQSRHDNVYHGGRYHSAEWEG